MFNYSFTRKNLKDCITNHLILKMKLISVFLISAAVQLSASCYAQKVTLQETNASLQTIFLKVYTQTGYQFFYEDELLEKSSKVSIDVKNVALEYALDKCFEDQPLQYKIVNQTIVVSPKTKQEGKTITGRVVDENDEPIVGVAVFIKSKLRGTSTDTDGKFVLTDVDDTDILVFSAINLETQEVLVGKNLLFFVTMQVKPSLLDEVQIIGYGTTTRRTATSSVATIGSTAIQTQSVVSPLDALQGRAAGVYISNTSGAIGAMPSIQIRGVGTLNTGVDVAHQPLYIVDGAIIPGSGIVASPSSGATNHAFGNYFGQEGGTNPFTFLNPHDIESIEILKDADATSIYGSRGTNGVVIITTKKGKAGATKFNLDLNTGTTQGSFIAPRMSTQQYLSMRSDAFAMGNPTTANALNPIEATALNAPDLKTWDQNAYSDWNTFEYGNPARNLNVQGNVSGGIKEMNFMASIGYTKNEDFLRGNPFQERVSSTLNLNRTSANKKFQINFSNNFAIDNLRPAQGALGFPVTLRGLPPNFPQAVNADESFWPASNLLTNARSFLTDIYAGDRVDRKSKTNSYINNLNLSYKLLKTLTIKLLTGYTYQVNNSYTTTPLRSIDAFANAVQTPGRDESQSKYQSINIEPQVNYNKNIGKGKLDALLGTTFFERTNETYGIQIDGYDSDLLLGAWGAGKVARASSTAFKYRFNSVFGRVNYNHDGKYLLNATFRRDGSSRFGPENKWANFGAIGAGWVFSNEAFLKDNGIFSYGKIRGSYGTTGNDNINNFRYTSLFSGSNIIYGSQLGLSPSFLPVPGFKWENTTKFDVGLELGFLEDRFLLNINRFRNLSTDLLVNQRIPNQTGFSDYLGNFPGVIENKGWEFELTTNNLNKNSKLGWKTTFTLSTLKNTLLEYPDLQNSPNSARLRLGEAIPNPAFPSNLVRTLIFTGVNPNDGLPVYADINGDGVISLSGNNDRDFVGSTFPSCHGGFSNSFSYKGFALEIFIYFTKQMTTNQLYLNPTVGQMFNPAAQWADNYWTKPGDNKIYPRLWTGVGTQNQALSNFSSSSAAIENVFFARLRNVSISYTLPASWTEKAKISNVKVYARGQNLLMYSSEDLGKDPEVINPRGVIPRVILTGINITF